MYKATCCFNRKQFYRNDIKNVRFFFRFFLFNTHSPVHSIQRRPQTSLEHLLLSRSLLSITIVLLISMRQSNLQRFRLISDPKSLAARLIGNLNAGLNKDREAWRSGDRPLNIPHQMFALDSESFFCLSKSVPSFYFLKTPEPNTEEIYQWGLFYRSVQM